MQFYLGEVGKTWLKNFDYIETKTMAVKQIPDFIHTEIQENGIQEKLWNQSESIPSVQDVSRI